MTVTLLAAALAAGCAVAFSVADLLRKLLAERARPLPLLVAMSAGMAPLFLAWWAWQGGAGGPTAAYWLPGLGTVALNLLANLAFLEAVRIAPLSLTIPVLSLTPVFTTLLAIPTLGEVPSGRQGVGVALVVAGVLWLNASGTGSALGNLWRSLLNERGTQLMMATALLWSLAMPLDKLALAASGAAFHGTALNGGVALGALAVLGARGRMGELRNLAARWQLLTWLILVGAVALVLILLVIPLTWIGFIETMKRGLGSFLAVVWGRLFFAEPVTARKIAAVAGIAAGVALLTL